MTNFWKDLSSALEIENSLAILYVIDSKGSSPGRAGFKMYVTQNGSMNGSIGGGAMEQKLVELAKTLLDKNETTPFIKRQIHRKDIPQDQSGMICSGEQTVAFYFLSKKDMHLIQQILLSKGTLELNEKGLIVRNDVRNKNAPIKTEYGGVKWFYKEELFFQNRLFIIGGGHVGLALTKTMKQLGFWVEVFDDRKNLVTMELNILADKKHVVDYEHIEDHIPEGPDIFVVLVSFGFRTDEIILRRLLDKKVRYLGMMGSEEKVRKLFLNLRNEGYANKKLEQIHTPIGLPIKSKTPEEIAISIAAEIIQKKNS